MCCIELHPILSEAVVVVMEYSVQLATLDERHDEVEAHLCLEEVLHPTEEGMVELEKDVFFKSDLVYDFLIDNLIFSN